MIVPSLVFPLFLLAVNSAGLNAATQIPGFPTDSYLTFALAVPFIQGALFATMNSGQSLAEDIENGFFNRLALTPMRGSALIAGQLGGLVVIGLVQATVYLAVGLAAGAHFEAGVARRPGPASLLSILISIGFGGIGMCMAIRTGSGEAVQGMFPLLFVLPLLQLDLAAARPDPAGLVPDDRDDQPGQLPDRGDPQPVDLRLGRRGAGAGLRNRRGADRRLDHDRLARPAGRGWCAHETCPRRLPLVGARDRLAQPPQRPSPNRRC